MLNGESSQCAQVTPKQKKYTLVLDRTRLRVGRTRMMAIPHLQIVIEDWAQRALALCHLLAELRGIVPRREAQHVKGGKQRAVFVISGAHIDDLPHRRTRITPRRIRRRGSLGAVSCPRHIAVDRNIQRM